MFFVKCQYLAIYVIIICYFYQNRCQSIIHLIYNAYTWMTSSVGKEAAAAEAHGFKKSSYVWRHGESLEAVRSLFFVQRGETAEDGASNSGIRQNVFRPRLVSKQQVVLTPAVTFLNGSKRTPYVDLPVFPNLQSNAEEQMVYCSRWFFLPLLIPTYITGVSFFCIQILKYISSTVFPQIWISRLSALTTMLAQYLKKSGNFKFWGNTVEDMYFKKWILKKWHL